MKNNKSFEDTFKRMEVNVLPRVWTGAQVESGLLGTSRVGL